MHDPSGAKPANYAALKEWLTKVRAAETPRSRAVENAISQTVVASAAATLTVAKTGPADFDNLTEAIRKAPSGSRILIRPGRYEESIILDKSLEIAGDGSRQLLHLGVLVCVKKARNFTGERPMPASPTEFEDLMTRVRAGSPCPRPIHRPRRRA